MVDDAGHGGGDLGVRLVVGGVGAVPGVVHAELAGGHGIDWGAIRGARSIAPMVIKKNQAGNTSDHPAIVYTILRGDR